MAFYILIRIDDGGLRPNDYHYTILNQLRSRADSDTSSDPEPLADIAILLTDSLIRLGYHLFLFKRHWYRANPDGKSSPTCSGLAVLLDHQSRTGW